MHLNALKPAAGFGVTWRLELPPYGYLVVSFQSSCKLIQVSTMPQVHCLHLNGWQSQPTCPAPFFGHFGLLANQTGVVTSTGWFFLLFPRFIFFHHLFSREIVPRYASTEWRVSCGWVFRSMPMWLLSILPAYSIWEQCIRTAKEHCVLFSCAALTRNDIPAPCWNLLWAPEFSSVTFPRDWGASLSLGWLCPKLSCDLLYSTWGRSHMSGWPAFSSSPWSGILPDINLFNLSSSVHC